jgi:hypothetical protein
MTLKLRALVLGPVLLLLQGAAVAQMSPQHQQRAHGNGCAGTSIDCATTATPTFAPDGNLWVAWAAQGQVSIARSTDLGKSFSRAVPVHPGPLPLDPGADDRPQIVVHRDGRITVAYATRDDAYNGEVFIARSNDRGVTFSEPRKLTEGSPSQRFEALALDPNGRLFAAWIDKRNAAEARKQGSEYAGAALAFSWDHEATAAFAPAQIARDNTCECCRIGVGFSEPGQPVVVFRNIFEGSVRDHAVITFTDRMTPGPVHRVSVDDWATDVCPHDGPSLAVGTDGSYHVVWSTAGRARQGVFYARSTDAGKTFSDPLALGAKDRHISRPFVFVATDAVHLVWKEFDGERTMIAVMTSGDGGETWSAPRSAADTRGASDHPLLVSKAKTVFLSWLTQREGYRLVPLNGP